MTWWAAGAVVGSALIGSNASKQAASAQSDAAVSSSAASNALQKQMFDKQTELNEPFRQSGLSAQTRLMTLLGIGNKPTTSGGGGGGGLFGGIGGALLGVNVAPIGASGDTSSPDFGKYAKDFGMSDFQEDPGYKWRLQQGQQGLERSAAARGGLLSGGAMKDALNYNQGAASQEYGNAFNRYQTNRNNQLNPLQSLAGQGQTATNQIATAAQNYGTNAGNNIMQAGAQAGAANASGYMGQANALSGALGTGLNYYQNQNLMNKLYPTANYSPVIPMQPGGGY